MANRFDISRLFRQRAKERPHEANEVIPVSGVGYRLTRKRYSDIYLWLVFNRIFAGMKSVRYIYDSEQSPDDYDIDIICRFLEDNHVALLWQWWSRGYIVVNYDAHELTVVADEEIKTNRGHVVQPYGRTWVVVYSDEYLTTRHSAFDIIRNECDQLDTLRSADDYLTRTFGSVGILSSKDMPMLADDKAAFMEAMKKEVGITADKFQFLISTNPVQYQPLNLPIEQLRLSDKATDELKLIADFFRVPFDLLSFSGASTYANQQEAVKLFYSDCIAPLAEVLLSVGRYAIRRNSRLIALSSRLTFTIDNNAYANAEEAARVAMLANYADLIGKVADVDGIDKERIIKKINNLL